MDIELKDYFKIDDNHSKIRGFLIAKDENGNVILKKENMIVKSGRQMILNAITGSGSLNIKSPTVKFGSNYSLTTADMTTMTPNDGDVEFSNKTYISVNGVVQDDLSIKYTIIVNGADNNYEVNSLGLFFNDKLFSRVVFDTIGLSANRKLTFTYYIYF